MQMNRGTRVKNISTVWVKQNWTSAHWKIMNTIIQYFFKSDQNMLLKVVFY